MLSDRSPVIDQGFLAAIEATSSGVVISDSLLPDDPLVYVNPAFERLTGYASAEVMGQNCRFLQGPETSPEAVAVLHETVHERRNTTLRLLNYRKDGSTFWNEVMISPIRGIDGGLAGFVGIQKDVSAEVALQRDLAEKVEALDEKTRSLEAARSRLQQLAYVDTLTGLPTRALFQDRLVHALARTHRTQEMVAVVLMDLDGFKPVNDGLGHEAGDVLLRLVAERMRGRIRETDTLARWGGDEFVLLMDTGVTKDGVDRACQRLSRSFDAAFEHSGQSIRLGVSIGVALAPLHGDDAVALLKHADAEMYKAKARNRSLPTVDRDRYGATPVLLSG